MSRRSCRRLGIGGERKLGLVAVVALIGGRHLCRPGHLRRGHTLERRPIGQHERIATIETTPHTLAGGNSEIIAGD